MSKKVVSFNKGGDRPIKKRKTFPKDASVVCQFPGQYPAGTTRGTFVHWRGLTFSVNKGETVKTESVKTQKVTAKKVCWSFGEVEGEGKFRAGKSRGSTTLVGGGGGVTA